MKPIKRYIPSLVYNEIQKLNFKNKDHLYIICDMVNRISIFKKEDKDYSNSFIDIPKYYFRDIICDSGSLSSAIDILKSNKIIICDGFYSKKSGKALGYKFNNDLISKLIEVEVLSLPLSKKIINNKNTRNNLVADSYKPAKNFFLETFGIDYEGALRYIDGWFDQSLLSLNSLLCGRNYHDEWTKIINKYNSLFMSISAINDDYLFFRKNTTNGRIDSNLTSLKAELKQFIIKEDLYQIDIVNSQPFILSLYLNSLLCGRNYDKKTFDEDELDKYTRWTSAGIFYEMFEREYFNKTSKVITRKEIKNIMFCIFYSKNGSYQKEKNIFKSIYPTIMKWIEEQKKTKHSEFAVKLQKIESKICIDIICSELDSNDIKYYTIHDAWLVDKKDIDKAKNIIYRKFYDNFYRRPELKIEKIKQ